MFYFGYWEVMIKYIYVYCLVNIEKVIGIDNEWEELLVSIIICIRWFEMIDCIVINMMC